MDNIEKIKVDESVQRVADAISSYVELDEKQNVKLDEWTVSDVEIAMKKKYGKVDKAAIEKLKKVQHRGNVDRNDLVKVGHGKLNVESVELDEAKPEYEVKYAKSKSGPIKVTKFMTLDQAKEFLAKVKKDGMNGIISKGGKPVKEEVELDEKTKWKMGDGRPRGGAYIENERFWDLPKASLEYIIKDAGEAIKANPKARKATTGRGNWADQINDAASVLGWRKKNGIKEEAELDEDIATMGAFIFGGFALLPAMIAFPLIDAKMKGKLSGGIEKTVGNMISKFKKDKNYKPTSAEVAASKELEKEVKKENPSLFKKVMAKVTKIKSKKEEAELDEAKYEYDGKVVKISKKEFAKVSKDYKNTTKGKERMMVLDPKTKGSISVPVQFEEDELEEARQLKDPKKEVLVVKNNKVIVIDKKDAKEYLNKGWELAEEAELDEATKFPPDAYRMPVTAKKLAKYAVKQKKGPTPEDYNVFIHAAGLMKIGRMDQLSKYAMRQDTDVRDKIIDMVKDTLGKDKTEKIFPVKIREQEVDESVQRVANALFYHEARKLSPSARAKRDALRDIGKDKSKDDDEVKATDADRERADRNIINKLKKSADVKGNYEIKFDKGPAKKVSYKLVQYALDKNEKMKPADKLKFQNELTKSYKDFLKALKDM